MDPAGKSYPVEARHASNAALKLCDMHPQKLSCNHIEAQPNAGTFWNIASKTQISHMGANNKADIGDHYRPSENPDMAKHICSSTRIENNKKVSRRVRKQAGMAVDILDYFLSNIFVL